MSLILASQMKARKAKSPAKVSSSTRQSARLQAVADKQRAEKEELVRKRMELLDENDGSGPSKKRNNSDVNQVAESSDKNKNSGSNEGKTGDEVVIASSSGGPGGEMVMSAVAMAKETLRLFNKHYLHFIQEEEKRCAKEGPNAKPSKKRPDLKAATKMKELNSIMYPEKRIGDLPGINVGHQFYSRAEMVAIGVHSHWLYGIDYMGKSYKKKSQYRNHTFPLAVAIVLSGMYEDDKDDANEIVYTGQGGCNVLGNKSQLGDQVMKQGNLALKNCVEQSVPVRVIRGHKYNSSKVYTYDGLYNVVEHWADEGISGFIVFKFRLIRVEGQPALTTNQVQFIKGGVRKSNSHTRGLVCKDISKGQEKLPIQVTNLVDDPPVPPPTFTYYKSLQVGENIKIPAIATGCHCKGRCVDPSTCSCARLNGSDFPYVNVHKDDDRLIEAKDVVYECGPNCGCGPECVNRTSQRDIRFRLEVFRTPNKGWAVRSLDFIPSGAPICEYVGVLKRTQDMDNVGENSYIFDIDCLETMRGIDGRESRLGHVSLENNINEVNDPSSENEPEFCIDAGSTGNVARFINHSCEPNLFVQCVLSSHQDLKLARVMLFAADNIPPMEELTYDYGYPLDSVRGPDGKIKQMACFCGAADCRKRLF